MRVRHPYSLDEDAPDPDARVHWGGRRRIDEVDEDGTFVVPDDASHRQLHNWAEGYGYDLADLVVDPDTGTEADDGGGDEGDEADDGEDVEYCETIKSDGEVCGRERPCRYHS